MGDMLRSEEMSLCQLFIQPEAAYHSVSLLGEAGVVQFRDLNMEMSAFQRKFVSEVRRCEEMERRLRYIGSEVKKDGLAVPELTSMPVAPNPREIIDLETHVERTESEIMEMSHNAVNLRSNFMELVELRHVLEKTDAFFQEQEGDSVNRALIGEDQASRTQLGFVAGVVPRERVFAFERMLWRISRGNVLLRRADIEDPLHDPSTGNMLAKTVFVAFYQGEELKARVKKVCTGFHATLYPCPASSQERMSMVEEVKTRLEDLTLVLNQTDDHRQRVLVSVARELPKWTVMVRKMKAIYHTMNFFNMDVTKKCLISECWVPTKDLVIVNQCLSDGGKAVGSTIPSFLNIIKTPEVPPTFNRTNKFTRSFQNLIDAYGIATYREVNPALYSIVTFPFLFGVMFGDIGHGTILTIFGAWMCLYEKNLSKKKTNNEIWNIFFGGRYIILLMGFFSIYNGFIYNDIFSKSLNIFGSSWKVNFNKQNISDNPELALDPSIRKQDYLQYPYPFGIDPVWQLAESNKIMFLNTFKMKISIIFGVIHMIFGVSLSVINHLHFKRPVYILLEFVPQVLFLLCLFFYLVVLMFVKFVMYSGENDVVNMKKGIHCAPFLLITFINMMLMSSPKDTETVQPGGERCDLWMYPYQDTVQKTLIAVALLSIPVLLLGKPLYIILNRRRQVLNAKPGANGNTEMQVLNGSAGGAGESSGHGGGDHADEPISEMFIYQSIHTIEYVLSTISHTASYLRLWALSLAHAQLSDVLWKMVLAKLGFMFPNWVGGIVLYFIFAAWAFFTVAILVMMEGLSAFLHTLRLHWIEFMSKFYSGLGYAFVPFSLKTILDTTDDIVVE